MPGDLMGTSVIIAILDWNGWSTYKQYLLLQNDGKLVKIVHPNIENK